jgi:hypothetical protein
MEERRTKKAILAIDLELPDTNRSPIPLLYTILDFNNMLFKNILNFTHFPYPFSK